MMKEQSHPVSTPMEFEITLTPGPEYLLAVLSGRQSIDAVQALLARLKREAEQRGQSRILVDYRKVTGLGDLSTRDRLALGHRIAQMFGPTYRLAVLVMSTQVNRNTEFSAVIEGAHMITTDSERDARAWLLQEDPR